MIDNRKMSAYITKEEWRFLSYPIKMENRAKFPRWSLDNVSSYGNLVYIKISLNGNFWSDLDNLFSIYVDEWENT